jgi:hypothetical protein
VRVVLALATNVPQGCINSDAAGISRTGTCSGEMQLNSMAASSPRPLYLSAVLLLCIILVTS